MEDSEPIMSAEGSAEAEWLQTVAAAPRYSMLHKWAKRIRIAKEALQKAQPYDPATLERALKFSASLFQTMRQDADHNQRMQGNAHQSETFLYEDSIDEGLHLAQTVNEGLRALFPQEWREYHFGTDGHYIIHTLKEKAQINKPIEQIGGTPSKIATLQFYIASICAKSMKESHYSGEFASTIERHSAILQTLWHAQSLSHQEWLDLGRDGRLNHMNKIALAADHIIRVEARSEGRELVDIGNSTANRCIVSKEFAHGDEFLSSGKLYARTGAFYNRETGQIGFGIDLNDTDVTVDPEISRLKLIHEATHRLSHTLARSCEYGADALVQNLHASITDTVGNSVSNTPAMARDLKVVFQHALYRYNLEEMLACNVESEAHATRWNFEAHINVPEIAASISKGLANGPEELRHFISDVQKLVPKPESAAAGSLATAKPAV